MNSEILDFNGRDVRVGDIIDCPYKGDNDTIYSCFKQVFFYKGCVAVDESFKQNKTSWCPLYELDDAQSCQFEVVGSVNDPDHLKLLTTYGQKYTGKIEI